jgi:hypothetical protein
MARWQRYVRDFDDKWLRGGTSTDEPLLGNADVQSLADLANSFEVVRTMRIVPVDERVGRGIGHSHTRADGAVAAHHDAAKRIGQNVVRIAGVGGMRKMLGRRNERGRLVMFCLCSIVAAPATAVQFERDRVQGILNLDVSYARPTAWTNPTAASSASPTAAQRRASTRRRRTEPEARARVADGALVPAS